MQEKRPQKHLDTINGTRFLEQTCSYNIKQIRYRVPNAKVYWLKEGAMGFGCESYLSDYTANDKKETGKAKRYLCPSASPLRKKL